MVTDEQLARIDAAAVGVLAHVTPSGRPNAVAVTPYVVDGGLVVTSTLALVAKAAALRADPRVALSAGGVVVHGTATVEVDPTPGDFDAAIRSQELRKYPPARSLLALPFHRRLLPWYVGRVIVRIRPERVDDAAWGDEATVTIVDPDGRLRLVPVPRPADLDADRLALVALPSHAAGTDGHILIADDLDPARPDEGRGPAGGGRVGVGVGLPDGPALLLVHEEDPAMRELRQLRRRGTLLGDVLLVTSRAGSLAPAAPGTIDELRSLRTLARAARANRPLLATWPQHRAGPLSSPARASGPSDRAV